MGESRLALHREKEFENLHAMKYVSPEIHFYIPDPVMQLLPEIVPLPEFLYKRNPYDCCDAGHFKTSRPASRSLVHDCNIQTGAK
jgi:hypothetical protein